jgi:hypothetical protein
LGASLEVTNSIGQVQLPWSPPEFKEVWAQCFCLKAGLLSQWQQLCMYLIMYNISKGYSNWKKWVLAEVKL